MDTTRIGPIIILRDDYAHSCNSKGFAKFQDSALGATDSFRLDFIELDIRDV